MSRQAEVQATRRAVLCAACAVPLVAACGGADPEATAPETVTPSGSADAVPTSSPSGSPKPKPTATRTASAAPTAADPAPGGASTPTQPATGPASTAPTTPAPKPSAATRPAGALVKVAAVPVGGGVIVSGIVVTQPSAGTFRGFSTSCTHRGCDVNGVSGGNIACPCHGSTFSVVDGSVTRGPASTPLSKRSVTVRSGWVCTT